MVSSTIMPTTWVYVLQCTSIPSSHPPSPPLHHPVETFSARLHEDAQAQLLEAQAVQENFHLTIEDYDQQVFCIHMWYVGYM